MNEQLDRIIQIPGVQAAVLASRDGLVVASRETENISEDLLAGVVATIFGTMVRSIQQAGLGEPIDSLVETTTHSVQMAGIGPFILLVIAEKQMNVAEVRRAMRQAINEINQKLEQPR